MSSNTLLNNLPRLELTSCLSNISTLRESDVDRNFISNVEFNYFTNNSFNDNQNIEQIISESDSFSALHSNIRSLSANHDHLTSMLSDLNCHFNIIGLTETKIRVLKSLVSNISIPARYHFISQPSNTEAGGVGFYIRNDCEFHDRSALTISTDEFEFLSIEIHRKSQSNIICSVIYRHPNSNLDSFCHHLTKVIDKLSNEKILYFDG